MIERDRVADWESRQFTRELGTDPSRQRWEDFTHTTDELVIVLEGEMEFEVEGQICHRSIGEGLVIPAGALHSARTIGTCTARWRSGYRGTE